MHAQVSVSSLDGMFEFVEGKLIIDCESANDSQTKSFMNHAVDFVRAVGRTAVNTAQDLLLDVFLFLLAF